MSTKEKKKNSGDFTVAHLISVIAFAAFIFLTYIGKVFDDGSSSSAVIHTFIITLILGMIVFGLTKVKSVSNDTSKWLIVEIVMLVLFVVSAFFTSGYMSWAIAINSSKEEIQRAGKNDLDSLSTLFYQYETNERNALNSVQSQLRGAIGRTLTTSAASFQTSSLGQKNNTIDSAGVNSYMTMLKKKYLGDNYTGFHQDIELKIQQYRNEISGWNLMSVSQLASEMRKLNNNIASELTAFSGERDANNSALKISVSNVDGKIDFNKGTDEFEYEYEPVSLTFEKTLAGAKSPASVVIVIVVYFLMLTTYFAAYRSTNRGIAKLGKGGSIDDGGVELYN